MSHKRNISLRPHNLWGTLQDESTTSATGDYTPAPITAAEVKQIATLAIDAKRKAYCPYSNFRVGAAVLIAAHPALERTVYQGSNVEVASTPVGICAERCAISPLVASIDRPELPMIRAIAVSTDIWPPSSPCGMCRQMIREFCELDTPIYMYGRATDQNQQYPGEISAEAELKICGEPVVMTIGELLPMSFGPNDMAKRADRKVGKIG